MEFKKISAPSLKELFIEQLETMILSGKLKVGEKLPPERELAESMQVSRAVVNAGITALANKGFLTIKPRIGTFVADYRRNGTLETLISIMNYNGGILRNEEIRSILELRIALDSLAIELCVPKITDDELEILNSYIQQMDETTSIESAAELAFEFQHELALISGNTLMPLLFTSFKVIIFKLWEHYCTLYGIEKLKSNTEILLKHLEKRDADSAINWIKEMINECIYGDYPIYYRS